MKTAFEVAIQGPVSNIKTVIRGIGIAMIKIWRSCDRQVFIKGILYWLYGVFILRRPLVLMNLFQLIYNNDILILSSHILHEWYCRVQTSVS